QMSEAQNVMADPSWDSAISVLSVNCTTLLPLRPTSIHKMELAAVKWEFSSRRSEQWRQTTAADLPGVERRHCFSSSLPPSHQMRGRGRGEGSVVSGDGHTISNPMIVSD